MTRVLPALVVLLALAPAASAATKARPDLVAKSVKGHPKTFVPGTRFTVKVTVRNSGRRRAGKSTLAVYLSRGKRLSHGALSIGLLPAVTDLKVLDVTVTPTDAAEGNVLTLSASTHGDNVTTATAGSASSSMAVTG